MDSINLKVANIIEESKLGGPQIRMVRVAAAMEDVDTLIIMPEVNSDAFQGLCEKYKVRYRQISLSRLTRELFPAVCYLLMSLFEVIRLAWLLRSEKVELVHVSGGSWQYKGVLAAWLARKPVIWHLNDTNAPGLIRNLFRFVSRLADGFIYASNRSYDYYHELCPLGRSEHIIPSLVDPKTFSPFAKIDAGVDDELLERLGDELVIAVTANVSPVKGLETLIQAVAELHNNPLSKAVQIIVIGQISTGQRSYFQSLQRLADTLEINHIEYCGPRDDVRALLRRCDIYVCSSNAESSPVAVWEAMAMAKPIISTDVGDVACHLLDGEAGFIVPVGDFRAMAKKIDELLKDANLRERFGVRAREIAVNAFAPENIAKNTMLAYKEAIEG